MMAMDLPRMNMRRWVMVICLAAFAAVPLVAEAFDQPFLLDIVDRIMIIAIAAVSLNLILGYGGMISFGHAAYLGIGAYCIGIPAYYELYDGLLHLPLAIVTSALFALVTGYICLKTRGVYFIMITLAFAQMAYFAFISIEEYGGDDGLVIEFRSEIPGAIVDLESNVQLYYVILAFLLGALLLVHRLVNSRFGLVIQGSKSNDERMQTIGYNTFRYRLTCYVIAGAMCGTAGWLLGNFNNFFSPEMIGWTRSGELIFMVVLGGAGTLFGPVLGAIAFVVLEEFLSSYTVYWPLIFGPFLILVVLFAREGLEGLFSKLERGPA
jgi:branched-chain amino acid transport system permease protein